jgi:uncharacterized protein YutE (UPF0331/DUF86 family)
VIVVDPDRVRRLIASIERWRDILAQEPSDIYRRRYAVQAAAQAAIDLANHVIASEGWRVPQDYGDAFTVLAEHHVITQELGMKLRGLAGLRNLLVHLYDEIDDERVAREAKSGLPDLSAIAQAVAKLVQDEDD